MFEALFPSDTSCLALLLPCGYSSRLSLHLSAHTYSYLVCVMSLTYYLQWSKLVTGVKASNRNAHNSTTDSYGISISY